MHDTFFDHQALWFTAPALVGTAFYLLRLALMTFGLHHGDVGLNVDHGGDVHHGDTNDAFKILSIQGIAAFLMGFGWGGIGALKGQDWSMPTSVMVGIGCGIGMWWLAALL